MSKSDQNKMSRVSTDKTTSPLSSGRNGEQQQNSIIDHCPHFSDDAASEDNIDDGIITPLAVPLSSKKRTRTRNRSRSSRRDANSRSFIDSNDLFNSRKIKRIMKRVYRRKSLRQKAPIFSMNDLHSTSRHDSKNDLISGEGTSRNYNRKGNSTECFSPNIITELEPVLMDLSPQPPISLEGFGVRDNSKLKLIIDKVNYFNAQSRIPRPLIRGRAECEGGSGWTVDPKRRIITTDKDEPLMLQPSSGSDRSHDLNDNSGGNVGGSSGLPTDISDIIHRNVPLPTRLNREEMPLKIKTTIDHSTSSGTAITSEDNESDIMESNSYDNSIEDDTSTYTSSDETYSDGKARDTVDLIQDFLMSEVSENRATIHNSDKNEDLTNRTAEVQISISIDSDELTELEKLGDSFRLEGIRVMQVQKEEVSRANDTEEHDENIQLHSDRLNHEEGTSTSEEESSTLSGEEDSTT